MPFLIDGYNLLRAVEKIQGGPESITDIQLCRIISAYLQRIDQPGQIVFDGIGPREKQAFENLESLEVIFSGRSKDADTVIEDKITTNTAPKRLTVVSDDRRLRTAAKRRKAISVKVRQFWQNVLACLNQQRKTPAEPGEKLEGISQSETEQWLKTFGLDE